MNAVEVFQCSSCLAIYDIYEEANDCCDHVDKMWECENCGDCYDDEDEANNCCSEKEK